jgi:hypothetical protein
MCAMDSPILMIIDLSDNLSISDEIWITMIRQINKLSIPQSLITYYVSR